MLKNLLKGKLLKNRLDQNKAKETSSSSVKEAKKETSPSFAISNTEEKRIQRK